MNALELNSFAVLWKGITRVRRRAGDAFLTNYFGNLRADGPFPSVISQDGVMFLDADRDFLHVLFAAASPEALDPLLHACPLAIFALDYVTNSFRPEWEEAFLRNGFTRRATYQRIASRLPKIPQVTGQTEFAREEEAKVIYESLPEQFDRYLDHLASLEQVVEMVRDHRVLVNRLNDAIAGAFIFQCSGQRAHLNHWWNHSEAGPTAGLELLIRAYHEIGKRGVKFVHAWVNEKNLRVIRIHRHFGLLPDGLSNLVYFRNDYETAV